MDQLHWYVIIALAVLSVGGAAYEGDKTAEATPDWSDGAAWRGSEGSPFFRPRETFRAGRRYSEWLEKFGMSSIDFYQTAAMAKEYKRRTTARLGVHLSVGEMSDPFIDGVVYTPQQMTQLLSSQSGRRHKRKADSALFNPLADRLFDTTIYYDYDGSQRYEDTYMIEAAMRHYESETCLRFRRAMTASHYQQQYLYFTGAKGCWSYVGKISTNILKNGQPVNLQSKACTAWLGGPVHEIGHALGLHHEQQRPDRDGWVTVDKTMISSGKETHFEKINSIDNVNVEYDYGSVMHYSSGDFSKDRYKPVIQAVETKNTRTMGQRVGLSYHDAKIVNKVYCGHVCPTELSCKNGGYTDPNDCSKCKCPEGLGGKLCDDAASGNGGCSVQSSKIEVTSEDEVCISSRNFESYGKYRNGDQCNYLLTSKSGCKIKARFVDRFRTYCYKQNTSPSCFQYVELKTKKDLSSRGTRYCCDGLPQIPGGYAESEDNNMVVTFDARWPIANTMDWRGPASWWRTGFKICYKLADAKCLEEKEPEPIAQCTTSRYQLCGYPTTAPLVCPSGACPAGTIYTLQAERCCSYTDKWGNKVKPNTCEKIYACY